MIEPTFHENIKLLADSELEQKLQELSKKYWTAYKLGKQHLLTQLQLYITFYKEELNSRHRVKLQQNFNNSLDDLIHVDK